mgnify:CR=1 FL=1
MSKETLDRLLNRNANSIGDRLQNASTVATTGGQIASYNI